MPTHNILLQAYPVAMGFAVLVRTGLCQSVEMFGLKTLVSFWIFVIGQRQS